MSAVSPPAVLPATEEVSIEEVSLEEVSFEEVTDGGDVTVFFGWFVFYEFESP